MHSHFYQVEFGPTYLAAGITTARDVGNEIEFGTALRDAAKQRRGLGPRMLLAGYIDGKNDAGIFYFNPSDSALFASNLSAIDKRVKAAVLMGGTNRWTRAAGAFSQLDSSDYA